MTENLQKKKLRILGKDLIFTTGNVTVCQNGQEIQPGFCLSGAESGSFVDFSQPVLDTSSYANSIPEGVDSGTWEFEIPVTGNYRLDFRYNNPGFQMEGARNLRDERNCRVMLDVKEDRLGAEGWLGWLIFNVSGYRDASDQNMSQTKERLAGNQEWNHNYLNCFLTKGRHTLTLVLQAPPGQAVYDGPNIDWIEIQPIAIPTVSEESLIGKTTSFSFRHPGVTCSLSQLEKIKVALAEENGVAKSFLNEIQVSPLAAKNYHPHAIAFLDVGPYNSPKIGSDEWAKDCIATHYQALLGAVTGDFTYSKKAIEILNTWSHSLKKIGNGNDVLLRLALLGIEMVCGAEIIKHVYNPSVPAAERWSTADQLAFESLLKNQVLPITEPFFPQANGNWDAIIGAFNLAAAVYLEDTALMKRCLRQFTVGDVADGPCRSMGALFNYIFPDGESQESSRDQVHARMGLTGLATQAWIAKNQGLDLFSLGERRLLKGFRYNGKYQLGEWVPSNTFVSDRDRGVPDVASYGFEIMLQEYRQDDAQATLFKQVVAKTLRLGAENEAGPCASIWEAFLMGNF